MSIKTTCPYCGVGCGIEIKRNGKNLVLSGDADSPVSQGMLCIKGQTLLETIGTDPERILKPSIGDWEYTVQSLVDLFQSHDNDSIALYLSGQMLMEDLYVAKKFADAFGIKNIESNSRLCMYSTVAANNRAYGDDIVPVSYQDIYEAETILIIGSNTAECHPIVFNHIKRSGAYVVCVDPRNTITAKESDLWIQVESGTDLEFIDQLPQLEWFKNKKTLTVYSQGITQSTDATDKVNAIINAHIATGNINKPGCGVLSLTGQTNAMGGRELKIRTGDLTATEFFSADQIKLLWVMGTNPAHSMINYRKIDNLIVSDFTTTLTTNDADIVLPATGWSEQSGHVKNSERRYLKQNAFLPPAGDAKQDWEIVCLVAKALGLDGFDFRSDEDIWDEMNIDESWAPRITVQEVLVTIDPSKRTHGPVINNGRVLSQWHTKSRTGRSDTLNNFPNETDEDFTLIHDMTNNEMFAGKEVELDSFSKQPALKAVKRERTN